MKTALINAQIFDGHELLAHHAVVINDHKIESILPENQFPDSIQKIDLQGNILCAGFIDFQMYGGDTAFFVKDLSIDSLQNLIDTHLQDGTTSIVPTLYSTSLERILKAIEIVKSWIDSGKSGVVGVHIEGPYINVEKRGAHSENVVRVPTKIELGQIIETSKGLKTVMTIAPEIWPEDLLEMLEESELIVSLGHSNATYSQCQKYFKKIKLVTHLYNAMRPFESREVGVVGAVLDHQNVSASIIVDGFHCDFAAVRIAKNIMKERLFLISDASFAKPKFSRFEFGDFTANFDGQRFLNDEGKLAGSAITLLDAVRNCVNKVGIPLEETLRMATLYPAKHLNLGHQFGKISADYQADMVLLSPDLELLQVWKSGKVVKKNDY